MQKNCRRQRHMDVEHPRVIDRVASSYRRFSSAMKSPDSGRRIGKPAVRVSIASEQAINALQVTTPRKRRRLQIAEPQTITEDGLDASWVDSELLLLSNRPR
jgi:hypothetical protein